MHMTFSLDQGDMFSKINQPQQQGACETGIFTSLAFPAGTIASLSVFSSAINSGCPD